MQEKSYLGKVFCQCDKHIAKVTINNPPVNSLNQDVLTALDNCFEDLYQLKDLRCVVLTGEGRCFVAGADIKEFPQMSGADAAKMTEHGQAIFNRIERFPVPVIAAVNGFALGGGLELTLVCDIRIAAENAKFGLPETTLGIVPGYGGASRLSKAVGTGYAKLMIYSGTSISARKGLELGLIQEVVAADDLMTACMELAEKISSNGPVAIRQVKRVLGLADNISVLDSLANEVEAQHICFDSNDKIEGVDAFLNKRKAQF